MKLSKHRKVDDTARMNNSEVIVQQNEEKEDGKKFSLLLFSLQKIRCADKNNLNPKMPMDELWPSTRGVQSITFLTESRLEARIFQQ